MCLNLVRAFCGVYIELMTPSLSCNDDYAVKIEP